jgi:hypothetical protein
MLLIMLGKLFSDSVGSLQITLLLFFFFFTYCRFATDGLADG